MMIPAEAFEAETAMGGDAGFDELQCSTMLAVMSFDATTLF